MTTAPNQTTTAAAPSDAREKTLPAPGRAPVAAPAAGYVGTLVALLTLAVGVIALRDSTVSAGWLGGRSWITAAIEWIDGLTFTWWMIPAGIASIIVGVWWVYAALRPRRRTAIAVAAQTSVWIAPADLARVASHAAATVPGVLDARSSATLRKIKVTVQITADSTGNEIKNAVTQAVRDSGGFLTAPHKVAVRTRTGGA